MQNHIFIDYENMRRIDVAVFELERATTITLLVGPENRLNMATVERLLSHSEVVEMVRIGKPGKDAVDFALTYYLGRKAIAEPMTFFHIVSKDKGFDPLIDHLKSRHIRVTRHESYASLTAALEPKAPPTAAKKVKAGPGAKPSPTRASAVPPPKP